MKDAHIVQLFDWLDEITVMIQEQLDEPDLDSLVNSLEILFYGDTQGAIPTDLHEKMASVEPIDLSTYSQEEIRKAIQLAILKGMQKTTQHQHAMTPETIAIFIGYLVSK